MKIINETKKCWIFLKKEAGEWTVLVTDTKEDRGDLLIGNDITFQSDIP